MQMRQELNERTLLPTFGSKGQSQEMYLGIQKRTQFFSSNKIGSAENVNANSNEKPEKKEGRGSFIGLKSSMNSARSESGSSVDSCPSLGSSFYLQRLNTLTHERILLT